MMRFDGESTVFSYENDGGISLFSVEPPEGAITGGSDGDPSQGSGAVATRIRWWIDKNPNPTGPEYIGGITGVGWFRTWETPGLTYKGPFEGVTDQQIYEEAKNTGTLNNIFNTWNTTANQSDLAGFPLYLTENEETSGCISVGGITG